MTRATSLAGLAILFAFLGLGEAAARLGGWPVPGNVAGMVLLFLALRLGWVKPAWIEAPAKFLLNNLALFFVPPGVGLMAHWGVICADFGAVVASVTLSTLVVLLVAGWTAQALEGKGGGS